MSSQNPSELTTSGKVTRSTRIRDKVADEIFDTKPKTSGSPTKTQGASARSAARSSVVKRLYGEIESKRAIKKICAKADQRVYDMYQDFLQTDASELVENHAYAAQECSAINVEELSNKEISHEIQKLKAKLDFLDQEIDILEKRKQRRIDELAAIDELPDKSN